MRAATIAEERAHAHSRRQCWHAVKEALLASGVISSRPKTEYAKQAGQELVNNYGFQKLPVNDPYQAPVGSVLVYNANRAAGHVEIRTKDGFVSDFRSKTPSRRPLLGIFVKSLTAVAAIPQRAVVRRAGAAGAEPDAQCAPDCSERNCDP